MPAKVQEDKQYLNYSVVDGQLCSKATEQELELIEQKKPVSGMFYTTSKDGKKSYFIKKGLYDEKIVSVSLRDREYDGKSYQTVDLMLKDAFEENNIIHCVSLPADSMNCQTLTGILTTIVKNGEQNDVFNFTVTPNRKDGKTYAKFNVFNVTKNHSVWDWYVKSHQLKAMPSEIKEKYTKDRILPDPKINAKGEKDYSAISDKYNELLFYVVCPVIGSSSFKKRVEALVQNNPEYKKLYDENKAKVEKTEEKKEEKIEDDKDIF